jgi:hypothetical protein
MATNQARTLAQLVFASQRAPKRILLKKMDFALAVYVE